MRHNKNIVNTINKVVDSTLTNLKRKNLDILFSPEKCGNTIKIGNHSIIKKGGGVFDISVNGKILYSDIMSIDAVYALVERLVTRDRTHEIKDILKLEGEYCNLKNDQLFYKNRYDGCKNAEDREIMSHRIQLTNQKIQFLGDKIKSLRINL